MTKVIVIRRVSKMFRERKCNMQCDIGKDGKNDPCPGLLALSGKEPVSERPRMPVCLKKDKGDTKKIDGEKEGLCMLCQANGKKCNSGMDCASGQCDSKGTCMKTHLPGGGKCWRDTQCQSDICSRLFGYEGACAFTADDEKEMCTGVDKGSGGCSCSGNKQCKDKNECLGDIWYVSKGACEGAAAERKTSTKNELDD